VRVTLGSCRDAADCARGSSLPWYARTRPWRSLLNGRSLDRQMDPLAAAVRFELGELGSDQLPDVAVKLLQEGYDSPSLRVVAGDLHPDMAETGKTFRDALQELGVRITLKEALLIRARSIAEAIVEGAVAPMAGASDLYYLDRHFGDVPELQPFLREYWRIPLPANVADETTQDRGLRQAAQVLAEELRQTVSNQRQP
jgi:hypothetical protein